MSELKPLPYDPKLREAALEFTALCQKYDIGGFAVFASRSHSEFILNIDKPTWSIVKWSPGPKGSVLRMQYRGKSEADGKARGEATLGMLCAIRDQCGNMFMVMDEARTVFGEAVNASLDDNLGKRPHATPADNKDSL